MSSKRLNLTNCLEDFFECHAGAKVYYTYERNRYLDMTVILCFIRKIAKGISCKTKNPLIQVLIGILRKLPILDKIFLRTKIVSIA